jgi:choline dehydrogenase-like flavoprotein
VPQAAANNRSINHNRGKVLGGTSALNLLVWNRATIKEYDAWEELGNPGWGWYAADERNAFETHTNLVPSGRRCTLPC